MNHDDSVFSRKTKAECFMGLVKERSGLGAVPFFVMFYYQLVLCKDNFIVWMLLVING